MLIEYYSCMRIISIHDLLFLCAVHSHIGAKIHTKYFQIRDKKAWMWKRNVLEMATCMRKRKEKRERQYNSHRNERRKKRHFNLKQATKRNQSHFSHTNTHVESNAHNFPLHSVWFFFSSSIFLFWCWTEEKNASNNDTLAIMCLVDVFFLCRCF